jgi:hypothetical protein
MTPDARLRVFRTYNAASPAFQAASLSQEPSGAP